jgi:hypothetical protein
MSTNLMQGLLNEIERCSKLVELYKELPQGVGTFGSTMIQQDINNAKKAIQSGDITEMAKAYKALESCS